jgi:signal transduction histidine kinase
MHLGIKAKQIGGVSLIVGLAVVMLSLIHVTLVARVLLSESKARAELVANVIYQRLFDVVPGQAEPYRAMAEDGGIRAILASSAYSLNVTYAAICDIDGTTVAASDVGLEGQRLPPAGDLDELLDEGRIDQLISLYRSQGTLEVKKPLRLGAEKFCTIRVGVSMPLVKVELWSQAMWPILTTGLAALLVAIVVSATFAQWMLRPIHVIRSGLTRLGRGEFNVTLDLPRQDEFGELGSFFNTVSAQLSADRTQLAGQKANLESAVEHMEDEVAIFNPAGELLFANPSMRKALPEDPFGRPVDDLLPAGHPYRELVRSALEEKQSSGPVAVSVPTRDGAESETASERLLMAHAIRDRDQHLVGVMLVVRDVTALGRVQSMLNYSRKLMALGRLSAGVAHEVKNPLNAMTIHLELLKHKLVAASAAQRELASFGGEPIVSASTGGGAGRPDLGPALEHVRVIGAEIQRLDGVMQGFLKFTRTEELKLQAIPLGALIDEVVRVIGPECEHAGVSVVCEGFERVPDISGDPGMLRQAFLNLALNACQAMVNGGTLRLSASQTDARRVRVSVSDTGVGIKPEHLGKIFDLYFTTKTRGSGIGLSMVYRTVQLHDGEIDVESTEGKGTTFTLVLPQA